MTMPEKWTADSLFEERPESRRLFDLVRSFLTSIGPMAVQTTKTQVSFGVVRQFAWVWLPQMWIKKQPDDSITLTFALLRRETDRRIKKVVEPYSGRWTHHVVIQKESDFDDAVKTWLCEAHAYGAAPKNTGKRRPPPPHPPFPSPLKRTQSNPTPSPCVVT